LFKLVKLAEEDDGSMDVERRAARKRGDCKIFSLKWKMRVYVQAKEATASSFLPTVRLSVDFTVHFTVYIFVYLIGTEAQIVGLRFLCEAQGAFLSSGEGAVSTHHWRRP